MNITFLESLLNKSINLLKKKKKRTDPRRLNGSVYCI